MDRYSSADRGALARAFGGLLGHCDCYAEADYRPSGTPRRAGCAQGSSTRRLYCDDGTTYCAFEEGSGFAVDSHGAVECQRQFLVRQLEKTVPIERAAPKNPVSVTCPTWQDPGPATAKNAGDAPEAPLPAAFRVCRVRGSRPPKARFDVPVKRPGEIEVETRWEEIGPLAAKTLKFPRDALENYQLEYPNGIAHELGPAIDDHEDEVCLEQLCKLETIGEEYTYAWDSTLDGLAEFVSRLNAARPRELRLDTVLVNYGMYLTLFGNDRRTPSWAVGYPFYDGSLLYKNMSVLGETAFLHHPEIPHDCAYALSSAQGPVFAHGPSAVECTRDEIVVKRHCGVVEPPRGLPECPWGVGFGVVRGGGTDGERPGGG